MALSPEKQENYDSLTMLEKIAILLVQMGDEVSVPILKYLDSSVLIKVSEAIARLENTDKDISAAVLEEFYNLFDSYNIIDGGGIDRARNLIMKVLPLDEAKKLLDRLHQNISTSEFSFLSEIKPEQLYEFIEQEHPQTIALIIAHLNPTSASDVLANFDDKQRAEIVTRIAKLGELSPEILKKVSGLLENKLEAFIDSKIEVGGVKAVAEILNRSGQKAAKDTLVYMEELDKQMSDQIKEMMFTFDDIVSFDNKAIATIIGAIDTKILSLGLKGAKEDMLKKFTSNMSTRAAEAFEEELSFMGAVRVKDVENAQRQIIDTVKKLGDQGVINLDSSEEVVE